MTDKGEQMDPMNDEQLLIEASKARGEAHRAKSTSWAACSNRFFKLADELKRRGLTIPPCDCGKPH